MIFLLSSSGYVLYSSSCSCTGEEQTTFFVRPETCETGFHKHHCNEIEGNEYNCGAEHCHDCCSDSNACGCESPEVFFFKLTNEITNEEVKFVREQTIVIDIAFIDLFEQVTNKTEEEYVDYTLTDPPQIITPASDFLIEIQQLKIPSLA
jgi:hypothetical protein